MAARELASKKFDLLDFRGRWYDLVGTPSCSGVWLVWGASGNGKTSFMMQLSRYLSGFKRVLYDSLEEGLSRSLQLAIVRHGMQEVKNFSIVSEGVASLECRLEKRRSAEVVIIDSLQFTQLNKSSYKAFKASYFNHKLLILVSHAEGKHPQGRTADFIRYDADVKLRVEGYRAFAKSRYGGDQKPLTIWEAGAQAYWG